MPAVIGDVFGLGDVYIRQVSPVTVGIDTSGNFITESGWSDLRSHGWFGGGFNPATPGTISTVDRIDFSNDTLTASSRGNLSLARRNLTATGNSNYGWFGGGWFSPSSPQINYSTVDRIDFSNDSATASPRSILSATRYYLAATGNSNYGWFGGGQLFDPVTPSNTVKSIVDRINFANDSPTASPRGPLSLARSGLAATGNSNYGWFSGGSTPGTPVTIYSTVDRIDFSNDSPTTSVRGLLSQARYHLAATGNSNYGWFSGGTTAPGFVSTVDRIDFSNDSSTALVRGPLSAIKGYSGTTANSNYGWIGGGRFPLTSVLDRIDFSNDTKTASIRGSLSAAKYGLGATSGQAKGPSIKLQKAGNFGWFGGGRTNVPSTTNRIDRIDFSNDSVASSPRSILSSAKDGLGATGNSNYGWFGGSYTTSRVDRIDFSNDATTSVRGTLRQSKSRYATTGNFNYGWFGGGIPGPLTSVDRIDFSNDDVIASLRGSLTPTERSDFAATGNSNYGWFGGGTTGIPRISRVDRIDFSNDSATASPRGSLSVGTELLAATGNSNYGWFGGGQVPATTSKVDRIDFSNDFVSALPRGPLSLARSGLAATGNSNYGWFSGGIPAPSGSRIDRIDFSNDSVSAAPRGSLGVGRWKLSATSNTST